MNPNCNLQLLQLQSAAASKKHISNKEPLEKTRTKLFGLGLFSALTTAQPEFNYPPPKSSYIAIPQIYLSCNWRWRGEAPAVFSLESKGTACSTLQHCAQHRQLLQAQLWWHISNCLMTEGWAHTSHWLPPYNDAEMAPLPITLTENKPRSILWDGHSSCAVRKVISFPFEVVWHLSYSLNYFGTNCIFKLKYSIPPPR